MNAAKKLEKVQVASAIYDYFAAGILAFPLIASWYLGTILHGTHEMLGASGSYPGFDYFHLLFVNLFGGFAIMWSTLRIIKREPVMGLCDGLLRSYYAAMMLLYVAYWGITFILIAFIFIEIFWGAWQLYLYFAARRQEESSLQVLAD